ncbi:unnamed protein product, partial [Tilletia controversa]|uniref:Leptomycin B resistance protein pmd1 n=4 Tax=Tilletia TaxID=13289 RepID=A0A8X7MLC9_9BASI|nr:hypothetical protein CF336_g7131 [Tilletia laevis]KAE8188172.1 hypothetical protein CF328_g6686 [Tilletia controversa]CAD6885097.1 unnamed protein product [Tilletia caries]KAE8189244.1 hypothetical protein CF335_g6675 [Tilletia laevis]KAE8241003.1 hypothetical protein A4X06_0g7696 [Tilletia controversa]
MVSEILATSAASASPSSNSESSAVETPPVNEKDVALATSPRKTNLEKLSRHQTKAPLFLYLFTFGPPISLRSPSAFFTHPRTLYFIGFVSAIIAAGTIPSLDLNYGYWVNALSRVDITNDERTSISNRTAGVSAALGLANAIFTTIYFTAFCLASERLSSDLRETYVAATLAQDVSFFDLHGPGEVASRVSKDVNNVRVAFGEKTAYLIYGVSNLVVALSFAFARSPKVAGIMFGLIPLTIAAFAILGIFSEKIGAPAAAMEGRVATYVEQMLSSPRVVQAFSMQAALVQRLEKAMLSPLRVLGRRRAAIRGAEVSTLFFIIFGAYALFFAWGAFLISHGYTSVGASTTAFWSAINSIFGLANVVPHVPGIINGFLSLRTLRTTIERQPKIDVRDEGGVTLPPGSFESSFELKDVTFAYAARPAHASLRDVSLKIEPGKMTALVGPSGSGKSTIASLLIREADPETSNVLSEEDAALMAFIAESNKREKNKGEKDDKKADKKAKGKNDSASESEKPELDVEVADRVKGHGVVCYAGHDLRTLNVKWLRSQVAVVQQHPQLFTGTVFANVAAGLVSTPYEWIDDGKSEIDLSKEEKERYDATRAKVQSALEKAQAWEFVQRLPQGVDTVISGGRTGVLSGGQRQRVAIARALVSEPMMLALDEATSALDSSTEERIRLMLEEEQRTRGMTVVTIAHRLSTVEKADRILVIDQGRVVDDGTHEELMQSGRKNRTYRKMVLRQRAVAQGDEPDDVEVEALTSAGTETESGDMLTRVASASYGHERDERPGLQTANSGIGSSALALAADSHTAIQRLNSRSASTPHGHQTAEPSSTPAQHAAARRRYQAAALSWGGIVAVPAPTSSQHHGPTDVPTMKRLGRTLWARARPQMSFFAIGCIASVFVGVAFPLISWLTGHGIAALGLPDPVELRRQSYKWSLYLLLIAFVVFIACGMQGWFLEVASDRTLRLFQRDTLESLLSQEIGYFDAEDQASGGLTAALTSHPEKVGNASGIIFGQLLMSIVNVFGSVLLAFLLNWRGAVVELSPLILVAIFAYTNVVFLEKYETMATRPVQHASAYVSEQIDGIRTVAALGRQEAVLHTFRTKNKRLRNRIKYLVNGAFGYSMNTASMLFIASLVFYWSGVLLNRGQATNVEVFGGMEAVIVGSFSLMRLASLLPDYARGLSSLRVLTDWLERVPKIAKYVLVKPSEGDDNRTDQPKKHDGSSGAGSEDYKKDEGMFDSVAQDIVFSDVEMRYPQRPDHPALRSLDLTIKAGETTAFVGTSGSGKSSCLNLLSRFYDPVAGSITCGGIDIRAMPLDEWRGRAALVSQDPVLYEGSVRWNLKLGAIDPESVTDEEIRFACEQACILDFILSLPGGFDEDLGMKGMNLSGGQKQRLCIARALLRKPEILLLDEATSALDAESEATVQLALERASKGRTTVVIAHRLSTIRKADTIHVVEDGRIVESGSHAELLARKGRYLELIEAQL